MCNIIPNHPNSFISMNNIKVKFVVVVTLLILFLPLTLSAGNIRPWNLLVEYTETPLGIDIEKPRFSWQLKGDSEQRGCSQAAYRITVTSQPGQKVWDSGKISGSTSLNIPYEGTPLNPTTRYNWNLEVWDQDEQTSASSSWFETGLMNSDSSLSAWNGAKWIGGSDDDLVLYPSYFPIFRINYSVRLEKNSTRAGFIYGANDPRLMDKFKNIFQVESTKDNSYIILELNISAVGQNPSDSARLNVYRVGYHPDDSPGQPLKSFAIPTNIINGQNKHESHKVYLSCVYGYTNIFIDGTNQQNKIGELTMNPVGNSGDYIAFPMVGDIGFYVPANQKAIFSDVEILNYREPRNRLFCEDLTKNSYDGIFASFSKDKKSGFSVKDNSYQIVGKECAKLIANPGRNSMPMLRTSFDSPAKAAKARLYVTSRGVYEVYLNGQRIGNDYFNPGFTQYNKTHMYQTYDVTEYLQAGENALGALLGEGWWSGSATYSGEFWNPFGDRQSLLAKLVITYPDGTEKVIVTDPQKWTYCNDGPIVYGSFFQGEVYDATKESAVKGWSNAGFDDSAWKKTYQITDKYISRDTLNRKYGVPMVDDYSQMQLMGQYGQNVVKIKELTARSVEEVRPGVFVYDMGQNMVGVPKIDLSGQEPGSRITLRYAEVKYPDLSQYGINIGMIMLENIRGALAQDTYIAKGGIETINPRFTFHGYRFIEITGIAEPLPVESVHGEVISSIHSLASAYETSNPKVNKLWENITWSTFSNFLSIPTDCPQRNERMGWGGDISVFSRTATYLSDVPQFLRRHMLAMRDIQRENGRFPDVTPIGVGFGSILWGSAGITIPWESYQQYDDKAMLAEHYDAMQRYIAYLIKFIDPATGIMTEGNLGDWLGPEQDKNDNTLLWECYFIYDLELMHKIASVLGKTEDSEFYKGLYEQRKEFFAKTYVNPLTAQTQYSGFGKPQNAGDVMDTQVSYVLPLAFHITDNQRNEKFVDNFVATLKRENIADIGTVCPPYSLMTGFIGTAWINKALSDNGYSDVAYRVLQQTSYPSWLYSVEQGATTIWERLNSYTHTDGFGGNNSMNSFNHYSFGAVGAWMYNYSLGIERDENHPGFKRFILQPEPDPTGQMTYAKGHYDSMYGRIESAWEVKPDGSTHYHFTVPCNTTATLYLQAALPEQISENGKVLGDSKGMEYLGIEKGKVKVGLQSGRYHFIKK